MRPSKARIRELERAGKAADRQAKRGECMMRPFAREARRAELDRLEAERRRLEEEEASPPTSPS